MTAEETQKNIKSAEERALSKLKKMEKKRRFLRKQQASKERHESILAELKPAKLQDNDSDYSGGSSSDSDPDQIDTLKANMQVEAYSDLFSEEMDDQELKKNTAFVKSKLRAQR